MLHGDYVIHVEVYEIAFCSLLHTPSYTRLLTSVFVITLFYTSSHVVLAMKVQ